LNRSTDPDILSINFWYHVYAKIGEINSSTVSIETVYFQYICISTIDKRNMSRVNTELVQR